MVPNGKNDLYQLGEISTIFKAQPIYNYNPKFSTGFKSVELTGQYRIFIWFFLRHFLYFFSNMTWGQILLKNAPTT